MTSPIRIELYSDTQTRPTPAMRQAMADAPVADEQRGEDPTTNALCALVAERLGKPAAVLLPSGTMANQISAAVHCRPGDEIICDRTAHIYGSEAGGTAVLAGALIGPIDGDRGRFGPDDLERAIRRTTRYTPKSRVVVIEQTANLAGGTIWPLEQIEAVAAVAQRHGLVLHMDGARLFNAVVETGIGADRFAAPFDSVWIDLSKGLGCPVGAVLAGSEGFIQAAWQWKQRIGGAMRQSGIIAAAGVHALEHHIARLAGDHANAQALAAGLTGISGLVVEPVATNMVFFDVAGTGLDAAAFSDRLMARGVRVWAQGTTRLRAVTHLDVDRVMIDEAIGHIRAVAAGT